MSPKKSTNAQKSRNQANPIELGNQQRLECPFKDEFDCKLTNKQKTEQHDFRMHFFLHMRDADYWDGRIENLEKGSGLSMYCDMCSQRKQIKAGSEKGLRSSMICHLAVIHHELRIGKWNF